MKTKSVQSKTRTIDDFANSTEVVILNRQSQRVVMGGFKWEGRRQSLNVEDDTSASAWSKFSDTVSAYWSQVFHS